MISVVIPTHNRSDLLQRALASVLKQTYTDFEIIVVSDGSTDNTDGIMEQYKQKDNRIKYISYKPGKGGNYARNTGIKESKGDYVAFLDDDDEWYPNKLEEQLKIMNSDKKIGIVYTGLEQIFVKENRSYNSYPIKEGDLSEEILYSNYLGPTSTVMVKKKILLDNKGFDEKLSAQQDYELWIRICQHAHVGVVKQPSVKYYNYPGNNQISKQVDKYIESLEYILEKHKKLFSKFTNVEKKKRISNYYLYFSTISMKKNDHKASKAFIKKSLKENASIKGIMYLLMANFNFTTILKFRSMIKK